MDGVLKEVTAHNRRRRSGAPYSVRRTHLVLNPSGLLSATAPSDDGPKISDSHRLWLAIASSSCPPVVVIVRMNPDE